MFLKSPTLEEYKQIFERFCNAEGLSCTRESIDNFVQKHYIEAGKRFRRCQPRDVISHAIDLIHFERLPFQLTEEVLDRAFESCFTDTAITDD